MSGLDLVAIRKTANDAMEFGGEMHPSQTLALLVEVERLQHVYDNGPSWLTDAAKLFGWQACNYTQLLSEIRKLATMRADVLRIVEQLDSDTVSCGPRTISERLRKAVSQ